MILEQKILSYKGKVVFEKIIVGNFKRLPKFFQETEACFMFVEKGHFQFRTPEKLFQFRTGEGVLAKCGNYFIEEQAKIPQEEGEEMKAIGAYFHPSIVKELFDNDLSLSTFTTNYDVTKVNIDGLMLHFIKSIEFLLDNPSISSDSMVMTKLKEFLLLLSKTENAPSIIDFVASLYQPYVYDFKVIIKQNLYANLSLTEMATLCGMSLSSFKRKFSNLYQESPAKYILRKKMEKAKALLPNKDTRISDVAYDCGFDTISTFNRSFKTYFGKKPSEFR